MKRVLTGLLLLSLFLAGNKANAQNEEQTLNDALAVWSDFNDEVSFTDFGLTKNDSVYRGSATATIAGFTTELTVGFVEDGGGSFVDKLTFTFPDGAKLPDNLLTDISGSNPLEAFPSDLNAEIQLDQIDLEFDATTVTYAGISFSASAWNSIGGDNMSLTDLDGTVAIIDPTSSNKNFFVDFGGSLTIPQDVSDYLNMTTTTLGVRGTVDTQKKSFALKASLGAEGTPIGDQDVVKFNEAYIELFVEGGKPGLSLGGVLEVDPPDNDPMLLNGDLSIDLGGDIYGQGWMDGTWHNPFNLSEEVYVSDLGLGFGVNFSKPPFPLPIVGFQGQLTVGSANVNDAKFSGRVVIGLHSGDPTQNMIDAKDINATLGDIVSVFYTNGTPNSLKETLDGISISDGRLSIVAPGNGVELFGNYYAPGVTVGGEFKIDDFTGEMLVSITDEGVLAYGGMSKIDFPGFKVTSSDGTKGPEAFVYIQADAPQNSVFGVDGKINVLGIESSTNIYASDAGFSLTTEGKVLDAFQAKLEVAGTDLFDDGTMYVKASMKNDLFDKIGDVAAEHIQKAIDETNDDFDNAKAELEKNRPLLVAAEKDYEATKAAVIAENKAKCDQLKKLQVDKAKEEQQLAEVKADIAAVTSQINSLNTQIKNGFSSATKVKNMTCPSGSFKDIGLNACYQSCASPYRRSVFAANGSKACHRPAKEEFKSARKHSNGTGFLNLVCPKGTFHDPIDGGTCWNKESGWNRTGYSVKSSKAFSRVVSEHYKSTPMTKDLDCTGSSFYDLYNGGGCWTCPSGKVRNGNHITSSKACNVPNMLSLETSYAAKVIERDVFLEGQVSAQKAINDISNAMTNALYVACDVVGSSELVNADPRVAPKLAEVAALATVVDGFQAIVDAAQFVTIGTLEASKYIAQNAGDAAGIVTINEASFAACIGKAVDGNVALEIKGTYADQPIDISFDINLKSPDALIKDLADALLENNTASSTIDNGVCTKPNVPKPDFTGTPLADIINNTGDEPGVFPSLDERPDWAGNSRATELTFFDAFLVQPGANEVELDKHAALTMKVMAMSDNLKNAKATLIVGGVEVETVSLNSGIVDLVFYAQEKGEYTLEVVAENGSFVENLGPIVVTAVAPSKLENDVVSSIDALLTGADFVPNPFKDYLETDLADDTQLEMINLIGHSYLLSVQNGLIDTSDLPEGCYIIKNEGEILGRVVKQ